MTPARRSATPIPHARAHFYAVISRAIAPRPITTVSSWADKYRILTSKSSGEVGQWRTDRTPYLREVMDSLSSSHAAQRAGRCPARRAPRHGRRHETKNPGAHTMSATTNAGIPTAPPAGVQAGKTDGAHFAVNREQVTRAAPPQRASVKTLCGGTYINQGVTA